MTYKTYEVHFTVELKDPPTLWEALYSGERNLELHSMEHGYLFIPHDAEVTELKPGFEPGYFMDMALPDELRGGAPRYIRWWAYDPNDPNDADWVRVIVGDRNF